MKKFIILFALILMLVSQLSRSTHGSDGPDQSQGTGQPNAVTAANNTAESNKSLYDQAMGDFQRGGYAEALEKFKIFLQQEPGESATKEKVMRSMAECNYFLGIKGNKNNLLNAADLYKNIVQKYPDSHNDNAAALYRIANSYAALDFYYEAKREFENLYAKYPDSHYVPEITFRMGEMLYKARKFDESAPKFEEYVRKFPAGEFIKTAYFNLGDCYSQMHQEEIADKWYSDALKKWPELDSIPEDVLLNVGYHYFRSMKYRDALKIFFFYVNVFPEKESNKEVLFAIARSFAELDQIPLSLKIFSLLIERFPSSREAMESAIIMANLGAKRPQMRLPSYFQGMRNYQDPLKTYNDLLAGSPSGDYVEELLFQKGYFLYKNGRHKESFDTYALLLSRFPSGRYKGEVMKYFTISTDRIVNENYANGDYLAVSEIYFKSREHGLITGDNFKVAYSMGDSLRRIGLHDEAAEVFEKLMKTSGSIAERNKILLAIADIECERRNYDNVERVLQRLSVTPQEKDRRVTLSSRQSKSQVNATVKPSSPDGHIQLHVNRILGNVYFKKGLFDKAASAYARVLAYGEGIEGIAEVHLKNADCLKAMNSLDAAMVSYRKAIEVYNRESKRYSVDILIASYRGLGDCLSEKNEYQEAISMYRQSAAHLGGRAEDLWSLYGMGKGYAGLKNSEMADKTFLELKNKGGEGFWSNLADYALREYSWNEKYDANHP
ncbi:MAG: tetratricopeptide repeat protein [Syntrophales bacterium]